VQREWQPLFLELLTGTLCILIGLLVLSGWMIGSPRLINIVPGALPMVPRAALFIILIGSSLLLLKGKRALPVLRFISVGLMGLSLLFFVESISGWDAGINRLFISGHLNDPIRRLPPLVAISFFLISAFIWTYAYREGKHTRVRAMLGLAGILTTLSMLQIAIPSSAFVGNITANWWENISLYTQALLILISLSLLHLSWLDYKSHWNLGSSFTFILIFIMLLQFVVSVISDRSAVLNIKATEWVKHTQQVLLLSRELKRTLDQDHTRLIRDALKADKKYTASSDRNILQQSYFMQLKDATLDNPIQQEHLELLEGLLAKYQNLRDTLLLSLGKTGGVPATDSIFSAQELELFGQMSDIINSIISEDTQLLKVRLLDVGRHNQISLITSIASTILMITLLVCVGLSLNKEVNKTKKRSTELEIANKELEGFTYSVAHDLRTPLRALNGFSKILEEDYGGKLDSEGLRIIGVLRGESQRMGSLIDDLLTFSRLGHQQVDPEPIDMESLARNACDELTAPGLISGRIIQIDLHHLPPVQASEAMIRLLWFHLINNAIKFTKGREPSKIEINWIKGAKDGVGKGDEIIYFIRDNGAGFDMRHVKKLFGVFERLHSTEEFPGSGIGLSLVQRIVQRHNGRIWAKGEVGKGATFFFTLPNKESPQD
jgi:signal transduction histidine kinase